MEVKLRINCQDSFFGAIFSHFASKYTSKVYTIIREVLKIHKTPHAISRTWRTHPSSYRISLEMIRGVALMFQDLPTLMLQPGNWQLYREVGCFLSLYVFRMFRHTSAIRQIYSNLKDSSWSKNWIKSWTFSCVHFYNFCRRLTPK